MQVRTNRAPPRTQLDFSDEYRAGSCKCEAEEGLKNSRPLYSVTMNAPAMDITVPTDLAWLVNCVKSSFSILNVNNQNDLRNFFLSEISNTKNKNGPDPRRTASRNVKAGMRFPIAAPRVGELSLIAANPRTDTKHILQSKYTY